jgi:Ca2+-binding EF-hand superfamily protein
LNILESAEKIDLEQFSQYFGSSYFGTFSRVELRYVFELFDKDRDGNLGLNDLGIMFKTLGWENNFDLKHIFNAMDINKDGKICFEGN